jgi:hypothetical protein
MFTYAIYPARRKRALSLPGSLRLAPGSDKYANGIVECLSRDNARKQFAPCWTFESLFTSNLTPSDFFLALDGECVVGCLACWDQSAFKQTVVRGYSGSLARWRKLLNMFSSFAGWPYLPEPNTPLRHSYACHLAVEDDDPAVFAALLRELYNHNTERGYSYFMLGLAESSLLKDVMKAYRPLTYTSQIYLVNWDEGRDLLAGIDERTPGLEIAIL